jgi:exonuclease SbcC
MLIRKVELENIKNYESASYEFEPGVTAINGPNGAGKTTILEAIAYSLFDSLPYKKEDFLKRGAKKGFVRVTFVSAVDGREYTVYRDTANSYYVFDPITKARLVEQKTQVANWIKEHLGIEPTTDIKTLFTSTIGVPQGTFTVDFLEQAAKRKIGFDKVLRVEEYQKASEELRASTKLVESKHAELQSEIAKLEGEVATLDNLLAERARQEALSKNRKQEILETENEQSVIRAELIRLETLQKIIEKRSHDATLLSTRTANLKESRAALLDEVRRCEIAKEALASSAEGFSKYNQAITQLEELEPKVIARDRLRQTLAERERELFKVEATVETIINSLKELEGYKRVLQGLEPFIEEQEALERLKVELQGSITELNVLKQRKQEYELEITRLRKDYGDLKKQVDEAETLRDLAALVPKLENDRQRAETEFQTAQVALERLAAKERDAKNISQRIANLEAEIHTLEQEINAVADSEEIAKVLPQYENDNQLLIEQITGIRLSIAREKNILEEVQEGLCPLLSQRCLNMRDGQGLDQFFKVKLGNEQEQLSKLERSQKALSRKLREAKEASHKVAALAGQRTQLFRSKQKIELEKKALEMVQKDIHATKVSKSMCLSLKESLNKIDQELPKARQAQAKVESLNSLQEHLSRLKIEGQAKNEIIAQLNTQLDSSEEVRGKLFKTETRLSELDDPRGRGKQLEAALRKEGEIQALLSVAEKKEKEFRKIIQEILKKLESYENLDEQISLARELRAASAKDYQLHIVNQPLAATLEKRREELNAVEGDLQTCLENLTQLQEEIKEYQAQYDEKRQTECKERLEETIHKLATLASELNSSSLKIKELNEEIARLFASQQKLLEFNREQERLNLIYGLSDFIRELLKKAGPFITEAHLQSISLEANQLYREVTGNPMVSLRWDSGYEVVLEEEGYERPFANLSGGEQMSAALAIRLALLKELSDIRVAFFDEPTTNMDEERRRNLAQQIGRIKDFNQLFVISHDDAFEGFTDNVISVGVD